jgi:hypothetical protein
MLSMAAGAGRGRRFGLLDAILLVAATGAGMALSRPFLRENLSVLRSDYIRNVSTARDLRVLELGAWISAGAPCLASWSFALLAIVLRAPRPSLRRLTCRPGVASCVAIASASVLIGAAVLPMMIFGSPLSDRFAVATPKVVYIHNVYRLSGRFAVAVAAAWVLQALGGRWRPVPTWTDRAGRLLGFWAIASGMVMIFLRLGSM